MDSEDLYETVVKALNECGVATARITPESRLAEDLELSWDQVDDMFAELGGCLLDQPVVSGLDYYSVVRGLDRHFVSPYRGERERDRRRFLGLPPRSNPRPESSLVSLTVADVVRILSAKRYVCHLPPGTIEDTVLRSVVKYARARVIITDDTRLREDLGFEWGSFHKVLVSIDDELEGAFYSIGIRSDAQVYWLLMESRLAIRSITVRDLIATVRENCWILPTVFAWQSEDRELTRDEIFCAIEWVLIVLGLHKFERINPEMRLDEDLKLFRKNSEWLSHAPENRKGLPRAPKRLNCEVLVSSRVIASVLIKLHEVIGARFTNSLELRDEFSRYLKTCSNRRWLLAKWRRSMTVADLANIVQANQWVEPKGCTR